MPCHATNGACAPQIGEPDPKRRERDGGESKARTLHGKPVTAVPQPLVRQREQRLDERGVLVVGLPEIVGASECLAGILEQQIEPDLVATTGVKVEPLVARVAELVERAEQHERVA